MSEMDFDPFEMVGSFFEGISGLAEGLTDLESKDGQESKGNLDSESTEKVIEKRVDPEEKLESSRRTAALDKEFWETF